MRVRESEFIFTEKYRPGTVGECVIPDRLKTVFQSYVDSKQVPNLMLTGTAGVGKTTVAMAMCSELGINYLKINSSDERGIDILRTKIKSYASTMSLDGGQKVIILDEADYLTPEAQAGLRGAIEEYSNHCTFIMTCNYKSKLIDALHSRSAVIDFKILTSEVPKMQAEFYKRVQEILKLENVSYEKAALASIIKKYFPDYRRTLNELQRLSQLGPIDESVISQVSDIRNIHELFAFMREKDFGKVQKWVVDNGDIDPSVMYKKIYDSLRGHLEPSSIPQAVITLSKYQYQAAFVADQEINLVACLTEMLVDCQFLNI